MSTAPPQQPCLSEKTLEFEVCSFMMLGPTASQPEARFQAHVVRTWLSLRVFVICVELSAFEFVGSKIGLV